jgi:hypothetical protein
MNYCFICRTPRTALLDRIRRAPVNLQSLERSGLDQANTETGRMPRVVALEDFLPAYAGLDA